MDDLIERLHDWYDDLDHDANAAAVATSAIWRGSAQRRRRRGVAMSAAAVCVALAIAVGVLIVASSRPGPNTGVKVIASTPTTTPTPAPTEATVAEFPDLELLRAWVAEYLPRVTKTPQRVRAEIVHTQRGATAVYGVQLTGGSFRDPFAGPASALINRGALYLEWNPAIHYPSLVTARAPIDMGRLGRVYALVVGHPTVRAPNGPTCGQAQGPARIASPVVRLDHHVSALPEVLGPPSGTPRITPAQAIDAVNKVGGYSLAPKVKATLATMVGLPGSVEAGRRLVWVLSVQNVEEVPGVGLPVCLAAAVFVDAISGEVLLEVGGGGAADF